MHGVSKVLFRKTSSVPAQWVIWVKSTRSTGTLIVLDSDHTVSTISTSTPMVLDSNHTVSTRSLLDIFLVMRERDGAVSVTPRANNRFLKTMCCIIFAWSSLTSTFQKNNKIWKLIRLWSVEWSHSKCRLMQASLTDDC